MPFSVTQEVFEIRSISPQVINPSILEGTKNYTSILGPLRAVSIERYAPIFLVNPVLTGSPVIPSTIFCSPGIVDSSPAASRHYQWYLDDVPSIQGNGSAFATFQTALIHDEQTITCRVTATNYLGSASGLSNGILLGIVQNIVLGEYHYFIPTGLNVLRNITVFEEQIVVSTGLWVPNQLTVFQEEIAVSTGMSVQDQLTVFQSEVAIATGMQVDGVLTVFHDEVHILTGLSTNEVITTYETNIMVASGMDVQDNLVVFGQSCYGITLFELLQDFTFQNSNANFGVSNWVVTQGQIRNVVSPAPVGGGSNVFMGSSLSDQISTFHVTLNIPIPHLDAVDTGDTTMGLRFWATTTGLISSDIMVSFMSFLDASNAVLVTYNLWGNIKPPAKDLVPNLNHWTQYANPSEIIPALSRKVRIRFEINPNNRTGGSRCQLDLISLQLYRVVL